MPWHCLSIFIYLLLECLNLYIQEDLLLECSVFVFVFVLVFVFVCVFVAVLVITRWTLTLSSYRRYMICGLQCWNRINVAVYWGFAYSEKEEEKEKEKEKAIVRSDPHGSDNYFFSQMTDHRQNSLIETQASDIESENNCALIQPPKALSKHVGTGSLSRRCSGVGQVGGVI